MSEIRIERTGPDSAGHMAQVHALCFTPFWSEREIAAMMHMPSTAGYLAGAQLLARGETDVAASGARRVFLEVSTLNTSAKSLYLRVGYREIGRRRGYYSDGSDALVLEKALGSDGQGGGAALINRVSE